MKKLLKNRRLLTVLCCLLAFAVLLTTYLVFIRPAFDAVVNANSTKYPQYLIPGLEKEKDRLLSVTFHAEEGKEYTVGREILKPGDITDQEIDAYISNRLKAEGFSAETEAFLEKELASMDVDTAGMSIEQMRLIYRSYVREALEYAASLNATWCVEQEGVRYTKLTVNAMQLSQVRVSSTYIYLQETVATTNPEKEALTHVESAEEWEKLKKLYGLDGTSWVEVKLDGDAPIRILVGDKDTTGSGYFIMVEGGDLIGVTNSPTLGNLLFSDAAAMVECKIIEASDNQYAYAYIPEFGLYRTDRIYQETDRAAGLVLKKGDLVGFTYRLIFDDGEKVLESDRDLLGQAALETEYNEDGTPKDSLLTEEIISRLVGRGLGDCNEVYVWEESYVSEEGADPVKVSVRITSLNCVELGEEHRITAGFQFPEDRGEDEPYNIYVITGPADMTLYRPNNTAIMLAMENISDLEGTVVALGLTPENIEKYGIWRNRVYVEIPYYGEDGDPSEDKPSYTADYELFVSDLQPDGTYYVGTSAFDLIAKVDGEMMDFVGHTDFDWVDPYIFGMQFADISQLSLQWNYGSALSGLWYLTPKYQVTEGDQVPQTESITLTTPTGEVIPNYLTNEKGEDGKATIDIYGTFSKQMVYLKYEGDLALTEEEIASIKEQSPCVLRLGISFKQTEGSLEDVVLRFYPYTAGRCLVEYDGVCAFYTFNTDVESLAEGFLKLLAKEQYNDQDRYPLG